MERLWNIYNGGMLGENNTARKIDLCDHGKISNYIYQWLEILYELCAEKREKACELWVWGLERKFFGKKENMI